MAIKGKAEALSLTKDPLKILGLMNALRQHIETDLNVFDLGTIRDLLSQQEHLSRIHRYQLTTENVLYETTSDGTYKLLPRDNTLNHIKTFIRSVLSDAPILPTPEPALSSPRVPTLTVAPTPRP